MEFTFTDISITQFKWIFLVQFLVERPHCHVPEGGVVRPVHVGVPYACPHLSREVHGAGLLVLSGLVHGVVLAEHTVATVEVL